MSKKTIIKVIIAVAALVILLIASVLLPNIGSGNGNTEYLLIRENASFEDVVDSLKQKESVFSTLSFSLGARIAGYPNKIKEGRYELKKGMSNLRLINNLMKGRQTPIRITFNTIRTKEQLCGRLADQLMLDSAEINQMLNDSTYLNSVGFNKETAVCLFIPNTYEVYWNISKEKLLERMKKEYDAFWTDERKAKAEKAKLQLWEVSTLASIVEEESNMNSERPTIAGLYLNRLHTDMPLQADPSIKFALGDFTIKRVLFKHIEDSKNSPYNTYIHKGLPPGPIRIPSIGSINAVLNYEKHPYFFMCAKGSGGAGHDFTVTFGEHLQNANRYRNQMNKLGIK